MHQCILVYKCLHDMVPDYLQYFVLNSSIHRRNTRQSNNIYLSKPNLEILRNLLNIQLLLVLIFYQWR